MKTFELSKEKLAQSKLYLAGGVASSLRASMKPTPLFTKKASGSRIWDIDGNEYIDYLLAYGPLILGHANQILIDNVNQAMQNGLTYGLQHEGEINLAKRLIELLPAAERVAFSGSGTEAVMLALRLARAYTGKTKVVRFYGHYHGWSDSIFTSFPSPDIKRDESGDTKAVSPGTGGQSLFSLDDVIVLPWNEPEVLRKTLEKHHHEIAAVITEPVMCNSGCLLPSPGYLQLVRNITKDMGIILIFDEVITGFRLGLGGAHARFDILPDLVVLGKAISGGVPLSAVVGSNEIMELIDKGIVNHLGTLNGNCVAMAAGIATINELSKQEGKPLERMEEFAKNLVNGIREMMSRLKIPGLINQIGPVFHMMFINKSDVTDFDTFNLRDTQKYSHFAELMLNHGVLVRPSGLWYISAAHEQNDLIETLDAVEKSLKSL
jgi:glutamate-1-semialdehyde 2,1-aminomutase